MYFSNANIPRLILLLIGWGLWANETLGRRAFAQDETELQELTIYINGHHAEIIAALTCAAELKTTVTGVAAFDSLSAIYGLRFLALGDILGDATCIDFSSNESFCAFQLTFPPLVEPAVIADAYRGLSYIGFAEFAPPLWPLVDYVPGMLQIYIKEGYEPVINALLCAFEAKRLITGVADFDSLSSAYGLRRGHSGLILFEEFDDFPESLCSLSPDSRFFSHYRRRLFTLYFPDESNILRIAKAYGELPYVEETSLNTIIYLPAIKSVTFASYQNQPCATSVLYQSWGHIKSEVQIGDLP